MFLIGGGAMNSPNQVRQLESTASRLANEGRWTEAGRVWKEVHQHEPDNPRALVGLAVFALQAGDAPIAIAHLRRARQVAPGDIVVLLTLSTAYRQVGDAAAEIETIEAALAVDPYFWPALLCKAGWIEHQHGPAVAASTYANVLKIAPPESHWPPPQRDALVHARNVVTRHASELHAHLLSRASAALEALPSTLARRWGEALAIAAGLSRPFEQICNQLHIPRLPAEPFVDRALFPWAADLEACTPSILRELMPLLAQRDELFSPYIEYRPGEPVNQWKELNNSKRWGALHLWRAGVPVQRHQELLPETTRILSGIEMAQIGGLCPNAMFSILEPGTHIPPHTGETNARLVAHLPLIVPENCSLRVGIEAHQWRVGELVFFNDTIEHEAHNSSDQPRVVLIFDVWNPLLTSDERNLVQAVCSAMRDFRSWSSSAGA
jgi:aspartate beta-hydroxylase